MFTNICSLQQEEKKMIRYREGKIVSTKGERFSQVTKEESEEMKKSIVNMNFIIWQLIFCHWDGDGGWQKYIYHLYLDVHFL